MAYTKLFGGQMDKLFSVTEAANYLNLSRWTIYSWLSSGRLSRVKLGSRCMIKGSEIQRLIDAGSRDAQGPDR
jgi:excisionase family DNA binding protein